MVGPDPVAKEGLIVVRGKGNRLLCDENGTEFRFAGVANSSFSTGGKVGSIFQMIVSTTEKVHEALWENTRRFPLGIDLVLPHAQAGSGSPFYVQIGHLLGHLFEGHVCPCVRPVIAFPLDVGQVVPSSVRIQISHTRRLHVDSGDRMIPEKCGSATRVDLG